MPPWLLVVLTSTAGGGLFSDLATLPAPSGPAFTPRASVRAALSAESALDTQFERPGERIVETTLGARLVFDVELTPALSAYAAPQLFYVATWTRAGQDRQTLLLDPPEAYLSGFSGDWSLRAGTLIVSYGSSDLVGPSDVVNPPDLRRGFFSSAGPVKIPLLGAELVYSPGPFTLRVFAAPVFTPARFYLSGSDNSLAAFSLAGGAPLPNLEGNVSPAVLDRVLDQAVVAHRPTDGPQNGTYALRGNTRLGALELAATVVHGYEALPRVSLDPSVVHLAEAFSKSVFGGEPLDLFTRENAAALDDFLTAQAEGRQVFEGRFSRRTLIGVDGTYARSPFVYKFDFAYTLRRTLYDQSFGSVRRPFLNGVAGLEYQRGEALAVMLEAFGLFAFDVSGGERLLLFEPRLAAPGGAARTVFVPGLALLLRYAFLSGNAVCEMLFTASGRGDWLVFPSLRWSLDDRQELRFGGVLVGGPRDGFGGVYANNDQVFFAYAWRY